MTLTVDDLKCMAIGPLLRRIRPSAKTDKTCVYVLKSFEGFKISLIHKRYYLVKVSMNQIR